MVITGSFTEAKNYFSVNILTTEGGEIKEIEDLNGKKVEGGTTLRFTAQPDQGYEFTVGHPVSDNSRAHRIH